jgi:hypothetical protein
MRDLSYDTLTRRDGGRPVFVARMTCHRCDAHADIPIRGGQHNPQAVAAWFRARGWEAHHHRKADCICPACVASRKAEKAAAGPKLTIVPAATEPTVTDKTPSREPTADERMRIRNMLDRYFDDKKGAFLDGMSDQKIGQQLNLPWAMVTKIREAAYGPIRVDPELQEIEASLAEALVRINAAAEQFREAERKARQAIAAAEAKLDQQRKRLGIAV